MTTETETTTAPRQDLIVRTRVKDYALRVSKARRACKFTRVGEDFLDAVEADLDAAIRHLGVAPEDLITDDSCLVTGVALDKAKVKLNILAHAIIFRKVMRHPSIGCTLKA